jgi:protein tyrosine phosphatase (PTP) superfamily phosphohydrolase (DUF442 family)
VLYQGLLAFVAFLVIGNLTILGLSLVARADHAGASVEVAGVDNFRVVDDQVFRGDAPTTEGYRSLSGLGVDTVIDLRAERDLHVPEELLDGLGIERVAIPIRDGQTPTAGQVAAMLDAIEYADGKVYVHCGAGVGRTGAMIAAYLVATGQASGGAALEANLSVGPPSLEQIFYASRLESGEQPKQPPLVVEGVSRVLDAPRRIWSRIG